MGDAVVATNLVKGTRTTEIAEETEGMSHSEILDMVMVAVVQMANGAMMLRDALTHSSEALAKAMSRGEKYKKECSAQVHNLAQLRKTAQAREESLGGKLKEAESKTSAAEAKLELALEKLKSAEAQSGELVRRLQSAEEEARAAAERATAAEKAAAEAGTEKAGAVAYADEAHARAEEAASRVGEAEAEARRAEDRAVQAEGRVREIEAKIKRVEAEAEQAVANYKASEEFKREVIEGSLDAYVKGFEVCKARVSAVLKVGSAELDEIQPCESDEESAEEEEVKPGPGEP